MTFCRESVEMIFENNKLNYGYLKFANTIYDIRNELCDFNHEKECAHFLESFKDCLESKMQIHHNVSFLKLFNKTLLLFF